MFPKAKKGGTTIAFPDVCKTPAPPAPFVPIPYPNTQYQENLQTANQVDAAAQAGNPKAKKLQRKAIKNLKKAVARSKGDEAGTLKGVVSASQAVQFGYTLHKGGVGKPTASVSTTVKMGTKNLDRLAPMMQANSLSDSSDDD